MKFGMGFPLGGAVEPAELKDLASTLEGSKVDFVTLSGHLLSTEPGRYPDRPTPAYGGTYLDPMVTFAYLAGLTTRLEFMTSTLILPLFPVAIVAKQASDFSILSGGRFILGVSISWNPNEYQGLGQDIHTRGARIEEQIMLLRRLWTEPHVTFEGRFHKLDGVGLNRRPPHPIPVWMGSGPSEPVLRRVARLGDGWISTGDATEPMARLRTYLAEGKRDAAQFGLTGRLNADADDPEEWIRAAKQLQAIGTTRVTVGGAPGAPLHHLAERVGKVKEVVSAALGG